MSPAGFRFFCFCVLAQLGWAAAADLDREIILAPQNGTAPEDREIQQWQARVGRAGSTRADVERLGWAYVAKARRTLDAGYYKLAEKAADVEDASFGAGADSRLLRGHVLHNLHRFHEAEQIARQLVAERGEPEEYALLSDALAEEGNVAAAVDALQHFANAKPGAEASSRISYLRWLRGDLPGAIAAMEDAARAIDPRDGATLAWTLARLSYLQLQAGRAPRALALASAAKDHAGDFAPALLACGRALLALGQNTEAMVPLQRAAELNPLPEYQWWLADALRANGRDADAAAVERALVARGAASDPRTLVLFLASQARDPATAIQLARTEAESRQDVFTHDALAWSLARRGELASAQAEMKAALAEGTRDARLFWHAAWIARALGREAEADDFIARTRPIAMTLLPSERRQWDELVATGGTPPGREIARCEGQRP